MVWNAPYSTRGFGKYGQEVKSISKRIPYPFQWYSFLLLMQQATAIIIMVIVVIVMTQADTPATTTGNPDGGPSVSGNGSKCN